MKIDLGKIRQEIPSNQVINPRKIFGSLPHKQASRYPYLRDVQAEVLESWFERRNEADLVIKMNTGSGKTLVGLLIMKSALNEKIGPVAYVSPDTYLRQQVLAEATSLGISTVTDARSPAYLGGDAVLVTNIYKIVNGKSVFGVGTSKIPISTVVIDDTHACLASIEDQFTIHIDISMQAYSQLFQLLSPDLKDQSLPNYVDLQDGDPAGQMLVPFWAWQKKQEDVLSILNSAKDSDALKFKWALVKHVLQLCQCVVSASHIELSLRCLPIDVVPSLAQAKRRIYMTATLADDSTLVLDFNASESSIKRPITPKSANDVGDRLILVPQEINPDIRDQDIRRLAKELSKTLNVVVIVPSSYRARFWSSVADGTLLASNIHAGVERLRKGHVGLVVLVNKYDGVDLPGDACRVLIIDGLPDVRRLIDKIEQPVLAGTEEFTVPYVQKIEQGMGRGVRSNDDHCVVLLMGRHMVQLLYAPDSKLKMTETTRRQLELSASVTQQLKGKSLQDIRDAMSLCLERNEEWLEISRTKLADVQYAGEGHVSPISKRQRLAFDTARVQQYGTAAKAIQEAIDATADKRVSGWLKQQLAEYKNFLDPTEAQQILQSAVTDNRFVLKPLAGINYSRLSTHNLVQANQCSKFLDERYGENRNRLITEANGFLDDVRFAPNSAFRFEAAMDLLGKYLGFKAQRPDKEYGTGPDVLFGVGELRYFIISCKNESQTQTIFKRYCDQLSGNINWFYANYDSSCKAIPIIIHPSRIFSWDSSPNQDVVVIDAEKLDDLRKAVGEFAKAVAGLPNLSDYSKIGELLKHYELFPAALLNKYTKTYKHEKKL